MIPNQTNYCSNQTHYCSNESDLESYKSSVKPGVYQIKVETDPDKALFDATGSVVLNRIKFRTAIMSRINSYEEQSQCMNQDYKLLKRFCHCKN